MACFLVLMYSSRRSLLPYRLHIPLPPRVAADRWDDGSLLSKSPSAVAAWAWQGLPPTGREDDPGLWRLGIIRRARNAHPISTMDTLEAVS